MYTLKNNIITLSIDYALHIIKLHRKIKNCTV